MAHVLLTCVAVLLAVGATARADVPTVGQPIFNPESQHSYYLLAPSTWQDAESAAVLLGGHLATIRNQTEQTWVFQTFGGGTNDPRSLWIGLRRQDNGGPFNWVSGEPVAYLNWYAGNPAAGLPTEPANAFGDADFGTMVRFGYSPWVPPGSWFDLRSPNTHFPSLEPVQGVVEIPGFSPSGPFQITYLGMATNQGVINYPANPEFYYVLYQTPTLEGAWSAVAEALFTDPLAGFKIARTNDEQYFLIKKISVFAPENVLRDGIDDVFKLQNGLDPLQLGVADQLSGHTNGAGIVLTWLEFYQQQFGRSLIGGEFYSREVSTFNFGLPTARVEAVSREISAYNGQLLPTAGPGLIGSALNEQWRYPDLTTPYLGNGPTFDVESSGVTFDTRLGGVALHAEITDNTILISQFAWGYDNSGTILPFTGAGFNGLVFTDLSRDFPQFSLTSSSGISGLRATNITIDGHSLYINLEGLTYSSGQSFILLSAPIATTTQEVYSREVSTFNFGVPSAPSEAISREVTVYNGQLLPTPGPGLIGSAINEQWRYPDSTTPYLGNGPTVDVGASGATFDTRLGGVELHTEISDNTILISQFAWNEDYSGTIVPFTSAGFNGLVLTDLSRDFPQFLLTSSSGISGLSTTNITIDGHSLYINFEGLTYSSGHSFIFLSAPFGTTTQEVYSREVSVFNTGESPSEAPYVSREISVFNFSQPTAAFEAISREVSVYNN